MKRNLGLWLLAVAWLSPVAYAQQSIQHNDAQPVAASESLPAAEPFVRTELFFGADKPDGSEISKDEFRRFLKAEITPRFPDGLTVLTGTGQFRDAEGDLYEYNQSQGGADFGFIHAFTAHQ